mmetsp:Transcript_10888/g.39418  ORF Transcript_10888/g.39418 Transcript_10888/m.39418 type:complete len:256 (-) Transcript_10888:37-804(-)
MGRSTDVAATRRGGGGGGGASTAATASSLRSSRRRTGLRIRVGDASSSSPSPSSSSYFSISSSSSSRSSSSSSSSSSISFGAFVDATAAASARYTIPATRNVSSNPRLGYSSESPAYRSGARIDASPNAPIVKFSAGAHFAAPKRLVRHRRMDTPIIGSVAPWTTDRTFTCHSASHHGMTPTESARVTTPVMKTACASTRSRKYPVGSAKTPPETPPRPRYVPSAAGSRPTRRASSGMIGPRRLMKRPLLKEPNA